MNKLLDELISTHKPGKSLNAAIKKEDGLVGWLMTKYAESPTLKDAVNWYRSGRDNICPVCKTGRIKLVKNTTCSTKCRHAAIEADTLNNAKDKRAKSKLEKYGSESFNNRDKAIKTLLESHGTKVSPKTIESARERAAALNTKGRKTLKTRYGVENPSQLPNHRDKVAKTLGAEHWTLTRAGKHKITSSRMSTMQDLVPDSIDIIDTYDTDSKHQANYRIKFLCKECGSTETHPYETFKWRCRTVGSPCSTCTNVTSNTSLQESTIKDYIKGIYGGEVVENTREVITPYELDIYLPDLNLAFEYCGLYWHSFKQISNTRYHLDKLEKCKEKGIKLITIFESDLLHREDILKGRIANSLGVSVLSGYARQGVVREINTSTCSSFLEANHLMGKGRSTVKLGLFIKESLVAVMTFLKGDKSKSHNDWELSRFCTQGRVPGAGGKLFKYFVNNYEVNRIISFADRRWGEGDFYANLGFELVSSTRPNYWYFKGDCVLKHRYGLRKNKDDDQSLTEWQNRQHQGWNKIYDCGSNKWIWKRGS